MCTWGQENVSREVQLNIQGPKKKKPEALRDVRYLEKQLYMEELRVGEAPKSSEKTLALILR